MPRSRPVVEGAWAVVRGCLRGLGGGVLLDAIARSDGTLASVNRELRRTRVRGGILGDIRFDAYGDLVEAPVTILRVVGDTAVLDRVVTGRSARIR